METNGDWDVEKHKQEHECDEHWELRRKFLLAHKDKFPEDELVCLAQVFTNIELLGCRYPKETMDLIADLSAEVAEEYREKQKTKLQRTFVKASDAASSKVKGLTSVEKHVKISDVVAVNTDNVVTAEPERGDDHEIFNDDDNDNNKCEPICKKRKLDNENSNSSQAPFGDLILFNYPGDAPQSIISRAVTARGGDLTFKYDRNYADSSKCIIYLNSKKLSEGSGRNQKEAKKVASECGLQELRKYYYTIEVNRCSNQGKQSVTCSTLHISDDNSSTQLTEDNIGKRMMKLMGWAGGGLGKEQQGIVEPVEVKQQLSRCGLGLNKGSSSSHLQSLKRKCYDVLSEFTKGDMREDLVFASEFINEERAIIHQVAKRMGLKSQSHGPKTNRTLVVSRKIDPKELVTELQAIGGFTDQYKLISPTDSQWC